MKISLKTTNCIPFSHLSLAYKNHKHLYHSFRRQNTADETKSVFFAVLRKTLLVPVFTWDQVLVLKIAPLFWRKKLKRHQTALLLCEDFFSQNQRQFHIIFTSCCILSLGIRNQTVWKYWICLDQPCSGHRGNLTTTSGYCQHDIG